VPPSVRFTLQFLARDAIARPSAVPLVYLSVHHTVDRSKAVKIRIMQFSPYRILSLLFLADRSVLTGILVRWAVALMLQTGLRLSVICNVVIYLVIYLVWPHQFRRSRMQPYP